MHTRRKVGTAVAALAAFAATLAVSCLFIEEILHDHGSLRFPRGLAPRSLVAGPPRTPPLEPPMRPSDPVFDTFADHSIGHDANGLPVLPGLPGRSEPTAAPSPQPRAPSDAARASLLVVAHDAKTRRPVNGAVLQLEQGSRPAAWGWTRWQGSVALGPFATAEGAVVGHLWHPRYDRAYPIRAELERQTKVSLVLETRRLGSLVGTIAGKSGTVPERATLHVRRDELVAEVGSEDFDTWTSEGAFRCDLAPGRYSLQATAPGFAPSAWSDPVQVDERATATVALALAPEGRVEGRLTIPGLEAGSALLALADAEDLGVDATLELAAPGAEARGPAETRRAHLDPGGRFTLGGLATGTVLVRLEGATEWTTVCVVGGSSTRGVLLAPPATTGGESPTGWSATVSGVVRDPGGAPLAGAIVRAAGSPGATTHAAATDAGGRFTLAVQSATASSALLVARKGYRGHVVALDLAAASVPLEVTLEAGER